MSPFLNNGVHLPICIENDGDIVWLNTTELHNSESIFRVTHKHHTFLFCQGEAIKMIYADVYIDFGVA